MNIINNVLIVEFDNFNQYSRFLPFMLKEASKINYKPHPDWYFCTKSNSVIFKIYNENDNNIQTFVDKFIELEKKNR